MDLNNQIELELYFADHFDTILFPVLADIYMERNDLNRARKVCEIGLKYHKNNSAGLFILANIEKTEGNLKIAEKISSKSSQTLKFGKEAFYKQKEMSLRAAYNYTSEIMLQNMLDVDSKEGIKAFIEKRNPKWKN